MNLAIREDLHQILTGGGIDNGGDNDVGFHHDHFDTRAEIMLFTTCIRRSVRFFSMASNAKATKLETKRTTTMSSP
jgi:hypothetical protein